MNRLRRLPGRLAGFGIVKCVLYLPRLLARLQRRGPR